MKTITLTVFTLLFAVSLVSAQEFRGKLNIKGVSQSSSIKYSEPVKLFKDFKDNKYQIVFTLDAKSDQIVLFDMVTTVSVNGRLSQSLHAKTGHGYPEICTFRQRPLISSLLCNLNPNSIVMVDMNFRVICLISH